MAKVLSFVALGLCGAATLFALLALALPNWFDGDGGHSGLFRACIKLGGKSVCDNAMDLYIGDVKSSLRATQAMVFLGFFALIGSLVVIILAVFVMKDKKILGYIAGILAIAAGFLLMIGLGIFVDKIYDGPDYGAGFAFDILGWLAAWATGILMMFLTWRASGEEAAPTTT